MWVNPFWFGVISTIVVEVVALFITTLVLSIRR